MQIKGIEPLYPIWKTGNLPLIYTCVKEVGFEPTIELTNRFTIYRLKPLGHSFMYIKII